MTKQAVVGCLFVLGLSVSACGSSPDPASNGAPNAADDTPFVPASSHDDASPTGDDANPSGDTASTSVDSGSPGESSDTGEPVHDSGAAATDTGTSPPDTGTSSAADSGTASKDTGTASKDTGTVATDTGTAEDTAPADTGTSSASCTALADDLAARLLLPESSVPTSGWYTSAMQGGFGPAAATFPIVTAPAGCDRVTWMRERVLAAAKNYIGLPYQHHHVPAWDPSSAWTGAEGPGLDCSNFTSWAYNLGLGIKFTSNVVDQAATAGRQLSPSEALEPGDLLYITDAGSTTIGHVVMYIDAVHIIDDTSSGTSGVAVRAFAGWYKDRFSHARRIIE